MTTYLEANDRGEVLTKVTPDDKTYDVTRHVKLIDTTAVDNDTCQNK